MSKSWSGVKDPDEVKDYEVDWSDLLDTDTIATSTWSVTEGSGLTIDSDTNDTTTTTVWLSDGVAGTYSLLNRVTTAGGRTYDQTCKLKVRAK